MLVLGIDASPSTTGFAVYDSVKSDFVHISKVRTKINKSTPTSAKRRLKICIELSYLLWQYDIDAVVIEDVYISQLSSALPLAMLRGSIEQTLFDNGFSDLYSYTASQVKNVITGNGQASKQEMFDHIVYRFADSPVVRDALGTELKSKDNNEKNEDMADACGVALTFILNPTVAKVA
ncbi:crossover junction endodeoxyribonuclease RuvC (plasmid) [Paenibacillus sp. EC2-1]|uniref:crossover junction endodeoxyribonuclease RuvC n=1 Tax=Paenibacillus sp. EC2-1 TaxID=3388665 RepID=UPI003BEEDA92